MTMTPPRTRGRPSNPNSPTPAARSAASRQARGVVTMDLDRDTAAALDAYAAWHAMPSRLTAVMRLLALAS